MKFLAKSPIVLLVLFVVIVSPLPHSHAQNSLISTTERNLYFWKADLSDYSLVNARIFPQISTGADANLQNLGKAWVAWTLNVSDGVIGGNGIYAHGQITTTNFDSTVYSDLKWFGIQDTLISIGTTTNATKIRVYFTDGKSYSSVIGNKTTDHQVYVDQSGIFFFFAKNSKTGSGSYYTITTDLQILSHSTKEDVIAAGIGGAVIVQPNGNRVFYTAAGNTSIPASVSSNLVIGQLQQNPVIYDLDHQDIWLPDNTTIGFPEQIHQISYFGLDSSIVFGNHTLYEFGPMDWHPIVTFEHLPFDYAIVDIGLYLGPVQKAGVGLAMSGRDQDHDGVPDTLEDYYGSLSTTKDSDGDGISDYAEIITGTNPTKPDATADPDHDGLINRDEIKLHLDPRHDDSDYGGALDGWEVKYGYNASLAADDHLDPDHDGVTNALESRWGTNPRNSDTDGDGMPDGWEIQYGISPVRANANEDPDHDGITNIQEYQLRTNPLIANPKPLFDGNTIEILISFCIAIPVGLIMWKNYPEIRERTGKNT